MPAITCVSIAFVAWSNINMHFLYHVNFNSSVCTFSTVHFLLLYKSPFLGVGVADLALVVQIAPVGV